MLNKLILNNFKCFQNNHISFNSLTIFVGGNGVGKSSIVQSLLLSKQSLDTIFSTKNSTLLDEIEVELNGPYSLNMGYTKNILSSNADSNTISFSLINRINQEAKLSFKFDETYGEHLLKGHLEPVEDKTNIPLKGKLNYLSAERLGPRTGLPLTPTSDWHVGFQGEYTPHILFRADNNNKGINPSLRIKEVPNKFSRQVEAWLQSIIPDLELNFKVFEDVSMASLKYKNNSLDTDFITAPNTGFGISYTLPIIVAGLILSNEENATLIVENPEAHLHPYGQSRIGRFLANLTLCGMQVIVETHSEHVINGARIEMAKRKKSTDMKVNFLSLDKGDTRVTEIKTNEFGELSDWPLGFFDQEQQDLKELFQLKRENRRQ